MAKSNGGGKDVPKGITRYSGPLCSHGEYMGYWEKRAYKCWLQQNQRCKNPNNPKFKYYGGKGILIKYSSRAFVSWYLHELKRLKLKNPSISRKDHNKDYCFSNISLEEVSENSKETVFRNGPPGLHRRKVVICLKLPEMSMVGAYPSITAAAKSLKISISSVSYMCRGFDSSGKRRISTKSGLTFRYFEGVT